MQIFGNCRENGFDDFYRQIRNEYRHFDIGKEPNTGEKRDGIGHVVRRFAVHFWRPKLGATPVGHPCEPRPRLRPRSPVENQFVSDRPSASALPDESNLF
jgi:hypothetical protein